MAARPTTPTTTPAAIPAVVGLLSDSLDTVCVGEAEAEVEVVVVEEGAAVDDFFADDEDSEGIE